jgi:hypothetical protein
MNDNDLSTPDEMAVRLRVTRRQVLRLVRTYHVPVLRPARSVVLFDHVARQALEEACRAKFADAPTRDHSKSTGEFARPARRPGSEYASALALTTKLLREKKLESQRRRARQIADLSGQASSSFPKTFPGRGKDGRKIN